MTVFIPLPERVEAAYAAAARIEGVPVDSLAADVLVSHAPVAELRMIVFLELPFERRFRDPIGCDFRESN